MIKMVELTVIEIIFDNYFSQRTTKRQLSLHLHKNKQISWKWWSRIFYCVFCRHLQEALLSSMQNMVSQFCGQNGRLTPLYDLEISQSESSEHEIQAVGVFSIFIIQRELSKKGWHQGILSQEKSAFWLTWMAFSAIGNVSYHKN